MNVNGFACDVCSQKDHTTENCPSFLSLSKVNDTVPPSYARLTLPSCLNLNDENQVSAARAIPPETRFGPLVARRSNDLTAINTKLPLKIFSFDGTSYTCIDTKNESECNWMCLVASASTPNEWNLTACQVSSDIYFITRRRIPPGELLKVWHGPSYGRRLGIEPPWSPDSSFTSTERNREILTPTFTEVASSDSPAKRGRPSRGRGGLTASRPPPPSSPDSLDVVGVNSPPSPAKPVRGRPRKSGQFTAVLGKHRGGGRGGMNRTLDGLKLETDEERKSSSPSTPVSPPHTRGRGRGTAKRGLTRKTSSEFNETNDDDKDISTSLTKRETSPELKETSDDEDMHNLLTKILSSGRGRGRGVSRGTVRGVRGGIVRGVRGGIVRGVSRGTVRGFRGGIVRGFRGGIVRGVSRGRGRGRGGKTPGSQSSRQSSPIGSPSSPVASPERKRGRKPKVLEPDGNVSSPSDSSTKPTRGRNVARRGGAGKRPVFIKIKKPVKETNNITNDSEPEDDGPMKKRRKSINIGLSATMKGNSGNCRTNLTEMEIETTDLYQCGQCGAMSENVEEMGQHLLQHALEARTSKVFKGKKPELSSAFKCRACPLTYRYKAELEQHMFTHGKYNTNSSKCAVLMEDVMKSRNNYIRELTSHIKENQNGFDGINIADEVRVVDIRTNDYTSEVMIDDRDDVEVMEMEDNSPDIDQDSEPHLTKMINGEIEEILDLTPDEEPDVTPDEEPDVTVEEDTDVIADEDGDVTPEHFPFVVNGQEFISSILSD